VFQPTTPHRRTEPPIEKTYPSIWLPRLQVPGLINLQCLNSHASVPVGFRFSSTPSRPCTIILRGRAPLCCCQIDISLVVLRVGQESPLWAPPCGDQNTCNNGNAASYPGGSQYLRFLQSPLLRAPVGGAYTERQLWYLHDVHGASCTTLSMPSHGLAAHMRCVVREFRRYVAWTGALGFVLQSPESDGPSDLTTFIELLSTSLHSACEKRVTLRRPPQMF